MFTTVTIYVPIPIHHNKSRTICALAIPLQSQWRLKNDVSGKTLQGFLNNFKPGHNISAQIACALRPACAFADALNVRLPTECLAKSDQAARMRMSIYLSRCTAHLQYCWKCCALTHLSHDHRLCKVYYAPADLFSNETTQTYNLDFIYSRSAWIIHS